MMLKDYKTKRNTLLVCIAFCVLGSLPFLKWTSSEIEDLEYATGSIATKRIITEKYRGNNHRLTFEFTLDNLNQKLGLFLGSGQSAIDEGKYYNDLLKIGKPIKVYYKNNLVSEYEDITRDIRRVEYQGEIIINRGAPRGWILSLIILIPIPFFIYLLYWIKKKYKTTTHN